MATFERQHGTIESGQPEESQDVQDKAKELARDDATNQCEGSRSAYWTQQLRQRENIAVKAIITWPGGTQPESEESQSAQGLRQEEPG